MVKKEKNKIDQFNKSYRFRCSEAELEGWKTQAKQHGHTLPHMIRSAINGSKISSNSNALAVCELRQACFLLRENLKNTKHLPHFYRISITNALNQMVKVMNKLMEI